MLLFQAFLVMCLLIDVVGFMLVVKWLYRIYVYGPKKTRRGEGVLG